MLDEDGLPVWSAALGFELPGGFRAWERLGVGTRCETWLVWSPALGCPAVLKLPPHEVGHPRARRSLVREVAALNGNLHPVLPRLYVDGTSATVPYLAVEYVDGPALDEDMEDNGPLSEAEAALLAAQLLSGLLALHQRGIAHLDVKPANVVLRDRRPVLIDFGSARPIGTRQPQGKPVGTVGYAAPEMEACQPVTAAMDLYSLGVTLREALGERSAPWLAGLLDADAANRPTPGEMLGVLSDVLPADLRPWPDWLSKQPRTAPCRDKG